MELYKNPSYSPEQRATDLLSRMTLREKIGQMNEIPLSRHTLPEIKRQILEGNVGSLIYATSALAGDEEQFCANLEERQECQRIAVEQTRLGIPLINGSNIVHGHRTAGPIPLGQAATFNEQLTESFAQMSAKEASADGIHWAYAPMVDIARDPRWGRIAEGYGEDPFLAGKMGAAAVRGFQGHDPENPQRIAACCKHYVGYGAAEGGRDYESAEISENTLRNIYLPPFEECIKAGAMTVMSAFHELDGTPITSNYHLLTDILKKELAFNGFVISDWDAVSQLIHQRVAADRAGATKLAVNAGVDMDMLSQCYVETLEALVLQGHVEEKRIDDAVHRILTVKFRLGLFEHPYADPDAYERDVLRPENRELACRFAAESLVLLKNQGYLLPLGNQKIYAMGPMLHEQEALLGTWATESLSEDVVTIAQALQKEFGPRVVTESSALSDLSIQQAMQADIVIVALGESNHSSGEAKSTAVIELPAGQVELLRRLRRFCKKVVTLICAGRPLALEEVESLSDALIYCWHGGVESGTAIAKVLSGACPPSGRLPVTMPRSNGQLPLYYNHKSNGRAIDEYYGDVEYPNYVDMPGSPLYPFGFGLGYTNFSYENLQCRPNSNSGVSISVTITNIGTTSGYEVAQCYVRDQISCVTLPVRQLKGFEKILLAPGQSQTVCFQLNCDDLSFWNASGVRIFEHGKFDVWVGPDCTRGLHADFEL